MQWVAKDMPSFVSFEQLRMAPSPGTPTSTFWMGNRSVLAPTRAACLQLERKIATKQLRLIVCFLGAPVRDPFHFMGLFLPFLAFWTFFAWEALRRAWCQQCLPPTLHRAQRLPRIAVGKKCKIPAWRVGFPWHRLYPVLRPSSAPEFSTSNSWGAAALGSPKISTLGLYSFLLRQSKLVSLLLYPFILQNFLLTSVSEQPEEYPGEHKTCSVRQLGQPRGHTALYQ